MCVECIEKKINFSDGRYAHIVITTRKYDAKNINDIKDVSNKYNINIANLKDCKQIHSSIVHNISSVYDIPGREGDGMVTSLKGIPLMIYTADCVPVVIIDTVKGVVANIHAGWRGTYEKITANAVNIMKNEYGCSTKDMKCIIGPSIGPCCYEVSKELIDKFNTIITKEDLKFYIIKKDRYYLDLWKINQFILEECGIPSSNIECMDLCTSCKNDMFFSYRKDNATSKRIGTIIEIKE